jgi:hypothetical protein
MIRFRKNIKFSLQYDDESYEKLHLIGSVLISKLNMNLLPANPLNFDFMFSKIYVKSM